MTAYTSSQQQKRILIVSKDVTLIIYFIVY